jgi:precorrin-6B methylase 1
MRFKTDENLPSDVAELLNQHGHDAESILQEKLSGTPDENLTLTKVRERNKGENPEVILGEISGAVREHPQTQK